MIKIIKFDFDNREIKEIEFANNIVPDKILKDDLLLYWICHTIFKDHIIIDHQKCRYKKGDPDFKLLNLNNGNIINVEIKTMPDGLHVDQLKFMFNNKNSYVLFYSIDNSTETVSFKF